MEESKQVNKDDVTSNTVNELNEKILKLEKEKEEYLNGWKRAKADYINYQKNEIKRLSEAINYSNQELIKELLSVLDSFELSFMAMNNADEKIKKGVEIIHSQLEKILNKYGLEPIKATEMKFDPSVHESIEEVESDKEPGTVIEEIVKGWKLNGKVIRPTRVKIAK